MDELLVEFELSDFLAAMEVQAHLDPVDPVFLEVFVVRRVEAFRAAGFHHPEPFLVQLWLHLFNNNNNNNVRREWRTSQEKRNSRCGSKPKTPQPGRPIDPNELGSARCFLT